MVVDLELYVLWATTGVEAPIRVVPSSHFPRGVLRMARYTVGARVSQDQYGPGTIIESNEHHTVIDFDEHGVRRFVTTMVKLESSTVAAPVKAKGRARRKTAAGLA